MATVPLDSVRPRMTREHRLFVGLAIAMAVAIVLGFGMQLATGRSSFASPWPVHLHAFVFFGWTALFLVQTIFAGRGARALHRQLGWIGAVWAAAVVIVGIVTTANAVRAGHAPFFFRPAYFLFLNTLGVLGFGGLAAAAIMLRRRTDWHRRLMICGMAALTGPAFGRLLPMPLLIPWAAWAVFAAILVIPVTGAILDRRARGRLHPAWAWGIGSLAVTQVAMDAIAISPPGLAIYARVTAGTPGATVPPLAYPAPPFGPPPARP